MLLVRSKKNVRIAYRLRAIILYRVGKWSTVAVATMMIQYG
jgi:hypothetical protein